MRAAGVRRHSAAIRGRLRRVGAALLGFWRLAGLRHVWDDEANWDNGFDHDDREWDAGRFDAFLFVQPEIALNTNVTRWLRLGATVGYRFTGGVNRFDLGESDFNGVVAGGNIQIGWF
jgi:hypothetical protein